jgi:hypothetical protein
MALFGSSKKKIITKKKIRPTVLRVQNVAKELLSLAKSYDINVNTIDFNILEVQTYTRMNDGTKETEWEEISEDEAYNLDDETALLNRDFQIKQMYEVEFFSKNDEKDPYSNLNLAVGANATKCKVYLSIKEGSSVSYNPRFEKEFLILINKSKVRAGILINIFDEMLAEAVSKISAHVRVQENVVYKESETILIAQSYEPTITIDDKLIFHYDKKEEVSEYQKKDYASRGFIQSVQKDELLIEYIKPKLGQPGRNCRGEYMEPKEALENNAPTFTTDDTIRQEETPKSIKYISNENGYIALDGSVYSIKTDVDIDEITFKTTGNIISGLDSDVNITVTEKDAIKDAIGNGMIVEVSEIEIDGNVGSNAKLTAQIAKVGGQTHKTATLKADQLDINVHKGNAYGKKVHITRLEHGIVDGDDVDITQALGGKIKAKEIIIEICASNVTATASQLIEIKKMQGSENKFIIDPLIKKSTKSSLDDNSKQINELKKEIKDIKEDIFKYTELIKTNTPAFNDLKKRLINYKKNGVKMPESFVKKYKQFQKMQEHLKNTKEVYLYKKDQLKLLNSNVSSFQSNIMDARVINRGSWIGYNEIIFKLIEPPIELSYKPENGSTDKVFGLVEIEEGEFEIQVIQ